MIREASIIIGCDDRLALSAILNNMQKTNTFRHNIISTARISDLIRIVNSISPDLIILSFRNNQPVLDDCISSLKKSEIPILCLTRKNETNTLGWSKNNIVFTCPFEFVNTEKSLCTRIHSIFLLKNKAYQETKTNSLTENAVHSSYHSDNRHLSRYVLELDQKVELLSKLKGRISDLCLRVDDPTRLELISIINAIKISIGDSKLWDDFKLYFEQTNPEFLLLLAQKHPNLTPKDLKYCCYLKMNMTNDDIRNLLGINQESVRTHKHRLKKKMTIPKNQDIRSYLLSLNE